MSTARRLQPFGTTIFAEMTRLAQEHDAVNLSQGFPDEDGPEIIRRTAAEATLAGPNQYAPLPGLPELRAEIARVFEAASGLPTDADAHVTVTSGCTEAIAASMIGLLNPGDRIVLFEPYYDSYRAAVAMADAVPVFVTLRAPDFTFDEAELRRACEGARAILVNTPHNPTGHVFDREELSLIAEMCQEHDMIALTDEVYEHLVFDCEHHRLSTWTGMSERTVTMSSLGKTYSLTGWKVGWVVASSELTRGVRSAHQFLTFSVPTPLQRGAVAALKLPPSYYEEFRSSFRARRDLLTAGLLDLGFRVKPSEGTYFLLADHTPFGFADDRTFCEHITRELGVAAIPPSVFYENREHGHPLVRFAFCKSEATLSEALRRLRGLVG